MKELLDRILDRLQGRSFKAAAKATRQARPGKKMDSQKVIEQALVERKAAIKEILSAFDRDSLYLLRAALTEKRQSIETEIEDMGLKPTSYLVKERDEKLQRIDKLLTLFPRGGF